MLCGFGQFGDIRASTICIAGRQIVGPGADLTVPTATIGSLIVENTFLLDGGNATISNSCIDFSGSKLIGDFDFTTGNLVANNICGTIFTNEILQKDPSGITVVGNTTFEDVIIGNTIQSNILIPQSSEITVLGDLTANLLTGDFVCVNTMLFTNVIKPKTGDTITIDGTLVVDTIDANTLTNVTVDLTDVVTNTVTANSITTGNICITDTLFTDKIAAKTGNIICMVDILSIDQLVPKTGDTITIDGNLIVDNITANNLSTLNLDDITANTVTANTVTANTVCIIDSLLIDLIVPKTGDTIVIDGNLVVDNITANNLSTLDLDDITANTITANLITTDTLCILDLILADTFVPKNGNALAINGLEISTTDGNVNIMPAGIGNTVTILENTFSPNGRLTSNVVTANIVCVNDEIQVNAISPKTGDTVTIDGELIVDTLTANTISNVTISLADITSNTITANLITTDTLCILDSILADLLVPKTGNALAINGLEISTVDENVDITPTGIGNTVTILENTFSPNGRLTSNVITANIVCVNDEIKVNTIFPKTGNVVTIDGDLVVDTITANNLGNISIDLEDITSNTVTANVVCVNDEIQVNTILPKTGNVVTVDAATLVGNIISAVCFDYQRTVVTGNAYAVKPTDNIISVLSNVAVTLTLPKINTLPNRRKKFSIVDEAGMAAINNIFVVPFSGEKIVGGSLFTIEGNYTSVTIYSDEIDSWFFL